MHGTEQRMKKHRSWVLGVISPVCMVSQSVGVLGSPKKMVLRFFMVITSVVASIWPVYGQCSQAVCWAALCHTVVTQSPGNTRQHPSSTPALNCEYNIPVIEGQKVRGKSMIYFDWVKMSWPGHDAHASYIVPKRKSFSSVIWW